jgi:hypothetical protein
MFSEEDSRSCKLSGFVLINGLSADCQLLPAEAMKFTTHLRLVKGKVFLVHAMKAHRGTGGIDPLILNIGARWS